MIFNTYIPNDNIIAHKETDGSFQKQYWVTSVFSVYHSNKGSGKNFKQKEPENQSLENPELVN